MKYVKWLDDLTKEDVAIAGGKGANLGELTAAGAPVPPGFVVLATAYFEFLEKNRLRPQIHRLLSTCDMADPAQLESVSVKIKRLLTRAPIPGDVSREILQSYAKLSGHLRWLPVAVRSSATAEDLPEASFAGQQESYLNVVGDANVVAKVKLCWLSLFAPRSIFYRQQQKFDHFKVGIAVPVQQMVMSDVSGVMFTTDPISLNKNLIVVEAVYGLGDYIVQGVVTPDHYEYDRTSGEIVAKKVTEQSIMEIKSTHGVKEAKVLSSWRKRPKLTDQQIITLAKLGQKIHQHYFFPQDIEWAMAKGKLYLTQSRPITTLAKARPLAQKVGADRGDLPLPILSGAPASPGIASGPARIVMNVKRLDRVRKGDVLVTDMTTPDFVPAMKRAVAIVTNKGGLTSHAAIVSRELGVPCVVGTTTATKVLKDNQLITVNGTNGEIYAGTLRLPSSVTSEKSDEYADHRHSLRTATKLYVNLAEPDLAAKVAQKRVDGVGLLRAEFMIAGIGVHPKKMIATGKSSDFINRLAADIGKFCQEFGSRPVIYRATDFKTNEYRALKGGDLYEPEESNPMLGFRGAIRYIKTPEVFNLELTAIKKVRDQMGFKNLWLMVPFVTTVSELVEVRRLVEQAGLFTSTSFKFFMMVEIPANVILLEDFIDAGIDGVSIGSNDLTMLIMGTDRDNNEVASQFDERDPAVLWALERTITICRKKKILCGICGQAPSQYPDLVEKLVKWGINSISVNPDAIDRTREVIYHSEQKLGHG